MAAPSTTLTLGFWLLPALMLVLLLVAVRVASQRAGRPSEVVTGRVIWVGLGAFGFAALAVALASSGLIAFGSLPPRPFLLFTAGFVLTVVFARSAIGKDLARHLPLSLLVGFQSFRILVELLLHRGALDGLTPPQMTYTGWNFDVVTGILALVVGLGLERGVFGARAAQAFNLVGALLLANVVTIAVLSMPTPFCVFVNHPPNVWIARAPFVLLPACLVPMAILGHLLLWRRLRETAAEPRARERAAA